jgi:hypothetical protein
MIRSLTPPQAAGNALAFAVQNEETLMASMDEHILKAAKEIVVKFIECGRLSPSGFAETFQSIYKTVDETVKARVTPPEKAHETKAPGTGQKPPGGKH